jgi:hypothetical protein
MTPFRDGLPNHYISFFQGRERIFYILSVLIALRMTGPDFFPEPKAILNKNPYRISQGKSRSFSGGSGRYFIDFAGTKEIPECMSGSLFIFTGTSAQVRPDHFIYREHSAGRAANRQQAAVL